MNLLPFEKQAYDFVVAMGQERASNLLDALTRRFDRRCQRLWSKGATITVGNIYRTPQEVELTHRLKIGLMLIDDDSSAKAHQRILDRIAKRNAKRLTCCVAL